MTCHNSTPASPNKLPLTRLTIPLLAKVQIWYSRYVNNSIVPSTKQPLPLRNIALVIIIVIVIVIVIVNDVWLLSGFHVRGAIHSGGDA